MAKFKVGYRDWSAPCAGIHAVYKSVTYKCDTEEQAVSKFHKLHDGKHHEFIRVWEVNEIEELSKFLGRKLLPRRGY